jgi:hypothetical protein|tara:strand:+ start:586 stop:792 length:207 start_codon:yes stop_codon:yes gene_type:complete
MVEIIKHHSKPFTYIVSNGTTLIGELVEDDIMGVLTAQEIKLFYGTKQRKFLVPTNKLRKLIIKPKYY